MDTVDELLLTEPTPVASRRGLSLGSILLLAAIVVAAVIVGLALIRQNQTQPTAGAAPDFTLTTLDGAQIRLADLKDRVVVINFWASWCGPCRDEAPALQSVWEKYRDRGVVMLGVAYTDTERNARAFIEEYSQTYPNGLDFGTKISDMYNIQGVPETFIVNRNGEIVDFSMYPLTESALSQKLDRILESNT